MRKSDILMRSVFRYIILFFTILRMLIFYLMSNVSMSNTNIFILKQKWNVSPGAPTRAEMTHLERNKGPAAGFLGLALCLRCCIKPQTRSCAIITYSRKMSTAGSIQAELELLLQNHQVSTEPEADGDEEEEEEVKLPWYALQLQALSSHVSPHDNAPCSEILPWFLWNEDFHVCSYFLAPVFPPASLGNSRWGSRCSCSSSEGTPEDVAVETRPLLRASCRHHFITRSSGVKPVGRFTGKRI